MSYMSLPWGRKSKGAGMSPEHQNGNAVDACTIRLALGNCEFEVTYI